MNLPKDLSLVLVNYDTSKRSCRCSESLLEKKKERKNPFSRLINLDPNFSSINFYPRSEKNEFIPSLSLFPIATDGDEPRATIN